MSLATTPLKVRKLGSQLYDEIERVIIDCSLPPGTALNDLDLAEQFGVSRTPVRDALHLLEASGLVERRRSTGWRVTPIRLHDVDELVELRALLEPVGLAKIVEWDSEPLYEFTTMFDGFSNLHDEIESYLKVDDAFHREIVKASGNSRLERAYYVVDHQLSRCKRYVSYRDAERQSVSLDEHRRVCHALGNRDLAGARTALLDHFERAHQALSMAIQAMLVSSADDSLK